MPFKRILCAVDFSPDSLEAFRVAAEIARLHSGALHLLNVIEAQPAAPAAATLEILNKATGALEQLIASAQPSLGGVEITSEIVSGQAFHEIIDRSRAMRSDLVVLGSKGHNLLDGLLMGGTAESVQKQASCSVLIVRPRSHTD
jgi:nucleotide-binding universal stress UspA family protein